MKLKIGHMINRGGNGADPDQPMSLSDEIVQLRDNSRRMTMLVGVLVFVTLVAVIWGGYTWADSANTKARLETDTISTVVAVSDIPKGTVIDAAMLAVKEVPSGYHAAAAESTTAALVGQQAAEDISAGAQLTKSMVAGTVNTSSLSSAVASGRNVMTLTVDAQNGQSGAIMVGDYVRVMASGPAESAAAFGAPSAEGDGMATVDLLPAAKVCALEGSPSGSKTYATVSLDLSAEEAAVLSLAKADDLTLNVALLPAVDHRQ